MTSSEENQSPEVQQEAYALEWYTWCRHETDTRGIDSIRNEIQSYCANPQIKQSVFLAAQNDLGRISEATTTLGFSGNMQQQLAGLKPMSDKLVQECGNLFPLHPYLMNYINMRIQSIACMYGIIDGYIKTHSSEFPTQETVVEHTLSDEMQEMLDIAEGIQSDSPNNESTGS